MRIHRGLAPACGFLALALTCLLVPLAADEKLPRAEADRFLVKARAIQDNGARRPAAARRTTVTELELNAFLSYYAPLPVGVIDPRLVIEGDGRVSGTATVDVDAVKQQRKSNNMLDPLNLMSGKLRVAAKGEIRTRDGQAWFKFDAADVSGIPVPKFVVQELLSYYSTSQDNPKGLSLDEPYKLPAEIREIQVARGQAVVVQ